MLSDDEVLKLSRWAMVIEDHYSHRHGRPTPMDIEWAKDGRSGELFIVQARPETVHSQARRTRVRGPSPEGDRARCWRAARAWARASAAGRVRVVHGPGELSEFREGEVLVAAMTDPDWEPVLRRAAAVVTDHGGRTCHAAIVSRELGIPCVVGRRRCDHAAARRAAKSPSPAPRVTRAASTPAVWPSTGR